MADEIIRSIIEGCHIAVYSSIKPGTVHRLRLDNTAMYMVSSCIGIIDYLEKAIEMGRRVKKGELAATGLDIGKLIGKALREAYRWTTYHPYPDVIVPSITNALILSYVEPDNVIRQAGELRRALELFIGGSRWRDVRELINALKSIGYNDMVEHLYSTGITYSQALTEGVSLSEAFSVLGSRWPGFLAVSPKEYVVYEYLKQLIEYYQKIRDGENAVIATYLSIIKSKLPTWAIKEVEKAFQEGLMKTKEGGKILFNLDMKLRRQGIEFLEYTPLLIAITQLAVYEGLRL